MRPIKVSKWLLVQVPVNNGCGQSQLIAAQRQAIFPANRAGQRIFTIRPGRSPTPSLRYSITLSLPQSTYPPLHFPLKNEAPARPCGRTGTKSGMGVRHALFPVADIRRPAFGGAAGFPTLFSTASGVFGLVAGPSSIAFCATTELLSEAFQLAWADGCATGSRTRSRHVCSLLSASQPLSARSATAFGGAFTRCHGSRLFSLRLPFVHRPAVSFVTSPASRKVFTGPAETPCPSRCVRSLCPAFRRLSFG